MKSIKNLILLSTILFCAYIIYFDVQVKDLIGYATDFNQLFKIESSEAKFISENSGIVDDLCMRSYHGGVRDTTNITIVVFHETANFNDYADAKFHKNYQDTTNRKVSWHYTIDDSGIYRNHNDNIICYHSGNSRINATSISVEICQNAGLNKQKVNENIKKFYDYILTKYPNIKVSKHSNYSHKKCPNDPATIKLINSLDNGK
jgi:N-acetylmuramoyl-L-alanine amidase CwlA